MVGMDRSILPITGEDFRLIHFDESPGKATAQCAKVIHYCIGAEAICLGSGALQLLPQLLLGLQR